MASKAAKPITFLIVDDDKDFADLIASWFQSEDIQVYIATNALQALGILHATLVDLVLTDLRMPGGDGISLLDRIRNKMSPEVEILLMTGFVDERRTNVVAKGASGIIQKPFSSRELFSWIHVTVSDRLRPYFEKRVRYPVRYPLLYGKTRKQLQVNAHALNISLNGLLVGTSGWVPGPGDVIPIQLAMMGEELLLSGKVQWARPHPYPAFKSEFGLDMTVSEEAPLAQFRKHVRSLFGK